jgi:hypothetical protein
MEDKYLKILGYRLLQTTNGLRIFSEDNSEALIKLYLVTFSTLLDLSLLKNSSFNDPLQLTTSKLSRDFLLSPLNDQS